MTERRIMICTDCEQVVAGRLEDDGSIILPLADNACNCGNETFDVVEPTESPVEPVSG